MVRLNHKTHSTQELLKTTFLMGLDTAFETRQSW